jgi:hypothetical protein
MTDDVPTCENITHLYEDGRETLCGQPATHASVNVKDGLVVYKCDRHRHRDGHQKTKDSFVTYFTEMTLEEAILIEVLSG